MSLGDFLQRILPQSNSSYAGKWVVSKSKGVNLITNPNKKESTKIKIALKEILNTLEKAEPTNDIKNIDQLYALKKIIEIKVERYNNKHEGTLLNAIKKIFGRGTKKVNKIKGELEKQINQLSPIDVRIDYAKQKCTVSSDPRNLAPQKKCSAGALIELLKHDDFGKDVQKLDLSQLDNLTEKELNQITTSCPNLKELKISSNKIISLNFKNLLIENLDLSGCISLKNLEINGLNNIKSLSLASCNNLETAKLHTASNFKLVLPKQCNLQLLNNLLQEHGSCVTQLDLSEYGDQIKEQDLTNFLNCCPNISSLTVESAEIKNLHLDKNNIRELNIKKCENLTDLSLSNMLHLSSLQLNANIKNINLVSLPEIESLNLLGYANLENLTIENLDKLKDLNIRSCCNLKELNLKNLNTLAKLDIVSLSIEQLILDSTLKNLAELNISNCTALHHISFNSMENLKKITVHDLPKMEKIDFNSNTSPSDVSFKKCPLITNLSWLPKQKLSHLNLESCTSLQHLELDKEVKLLKLTLNNSNAIQDISCINDLSNLSELNLTKMLNLGNLSILEPCIKNLQKFSLIDCTHLSNINLLNKATHLIYLNLSQCKKINDFTALKSLNNLETLILDDNSVNELKNLSTLKSLKTLSLQGCKSLSRQTDFSTLGNLTNLTSLNLSNNKDSIHKTAFDNKLADFIGKLTCLEYLNISECNLGYLPSQIGELTNLSTLKLGENSIKYLPEDFVNLKKIETLDNFYLNLQLKDLRGDYILKETEGRKAEIASNRKAIKNSVFDELIKFQILLNNDISKLDVNLGEGTLDAGGVAREYISLLAQEFTEKCIEDGELRLENLPKDEEGQKVAVAVGKLMAWVVRTNGRTPLGRVFKDEKVFQGLKRCPDSALTKKYEELSIKELSDLMVDQRLRKNTDIKALVLFSEAQTFSAVDEKDQIAVQQFLENLGEEGEELIQAAQNDPEKFAEVKKLILNLLLKQCQSEIKPLHALALGFSQITPVWKARTQIETTEMMKTIQGELSNELVLKSISYTNPAHPLSQVSEEYKKWIEEWVSAADPDALIGLVKYITGSPTVGNETVIRIGPSPSSTTFAHTCTNAIELPSGWTKNKLHAELSNLASLTPRFNAA